jgi:Protein of unknown function (DUF3662)/Inner membrane component of T3SS, cytoplasmic domain
VGVLQRFERRLGDMVEGVFARAFKSEVQPVEVAAALQRELDDQAAVVGRDRTLVPNHFVVDLGDHDHERLVPYEKPLVHELAAMVREHAVDQRYSFVGPVAIELRHVPSLETGVFHVRSDVAPGPEGLPPDAAARPSQPDLSAAADPVPPPGGVRSVDLGATTTVRPVSAGPSFGRIVVREGKNAAYEFALKHTVTVVGRGTDADLRLTDQSVSRKHAELRVANGAVMLNDLQSTNGTTVNGTAITTTPLSDGDEVRLGETVMTFYATHDPAAAKRTGTTEGTGTANSGGPADHGLRS